ncbi:hypothetical protein PVAND_003494 [Polypedilum vanderplanki]|uniref:Uncharacterized protein n=1 Tax=Polypedilum vanderplanki TaxID=319348 RepID=A0A9J6BUQ3_POLVA|nr:hypothetical protein PVAND_003494 [Polypedilum vanderplanki]
MIGYKKTNGNFYQTIFKTDLIDFCRVMLGEDTNPLMKNAIIVFRDSAPNLFKKCPYEGEIVVTNASIDDKKAFLNLFPTGVYKHEFLIFYGNKSKIGVFKLFTEFKNELVSILLK